MAADFAEAFSALKTVFVPGKSLAVKADTPADYTLETKVPSPFPQHKGQPLFFGAVRMGKAYVSLHLLPLYMCPELAKMVSPELKKRMQGKACFNFKTKPGPEQLAELKRLTKEGMRVWRDKEWL